MWMWSFIKKRYLILGALALIVIGYFYFSGTGEEEIEYDTMVVEKQDLVQEVSVTGHLKPYKTAELGFETGGRIEEKAFEVGAHVKEGDELMKVDDSRLQANLAQVKANKSAAAAQIQSAQAGVQMAQIEAASQRLMLETEKAQLAYNEKAVQVEDARLNQINNPASEEEIRVSQTKVENASISLLDAETNYQNVVNQADNDIQSHYSDLINESVSATDKAIDALITLTDIQFTYFKKNDMDSVKIKDAKGDAIYALFDKGDGGGYSVKTISGLNSGLKGELDQYSLETPYEELDQLLEDVEIALTEVKEALDAIPIKSSITGSDQSDLQTQKANLNIEISNINNLQQTINSQKIMNQSNVTAAETQMNDAKNLFYLAQDELNLLLSGSSDQEVDVQEALKEQSEAQYDIQITNVNRSENDTRLPQAQISQAAALLAVDQSQYQRAEADVQEIMAQLSKTAIVAPFAGVIAKQEGEIGEIAASGMPVITLISEGHFKIEAFIPEVDIAKVKVGDEAIFTLDALTSDEVFDAKVITMDPGETIVEGVTTYKVTLEFFTDDDRIRSNMTVNIDILTAKKENVIAVMQRSVIEKNGSKYIKVKQNGGVKEVKVETGLSGNDGMIEITEGLKEGDEVVTFIKED